MKRKIPQLQINKIDMNQMLMDELKNNKTLKVSIYLLSGVISLFALGFILKAVNYTAHNYKNLSSTLKRQY